jgi:hypothetical protein
MGGARGTKRGEKKFVQYTGGETLEDIGGDGRIISKLV